MSEDVDKSKPEGTDAKGAAASGADKVAQLEARIAELQTLVDKTAQENKSEREKKRKAAEAAGEYEKALKLKEEEQAELVKQIEALQQRAAEADTLKEAKTRLEQIEAERKEELLSRISDEEKRKKYSEFSLEALRVIIDDIADKPNVSTPKNGGTAPGKVEIDWTKATFQDKLKYARDNGLSGIELAKREIEAKRR